MAFLKKVATIVWKDLRSEFRSKEMLSSMLVFALLVAVIFGFAFDPSSESVRAVFPGIIWVAFLFAGVLGLGRSFASEKTSDCLHGLMLCPVDRSAIYFGKMLGNLIFMLIMELLALPVFVAFFNFPISRGGVVLGLAMFLGSLGFVAVGTLLAAIAANTRATEILLPIILFPVSVPIVIGAVQTTAAALGGDPWNTAGLWLKVLLAYDVVFIVVPFLLFEYVLEV